MTVIWGIRKIHRPHRPQTQYTDLLFSNYFLALGKYTDLLGKCTDPINRQINKTHDYSNSGSFSDQKKCTYLLFRRKGSRSLYQVLKLSKCFMNSLVEKKFRSHLFYNHLFRHRNSVVFLLTLSISFYRQKMKIVLQEFQF